MCSTVHEAFSRGHGLASFTTRRRSCTVHGEVWVCGSGISNGLANKVLVKIKGASSTPRESFAANLLLCADERIVCKRDSAEFVSQDPQETNKLGMNVASH